MRIICVPSNFSISRDSVPDHLSSIYSFLLVTILQGNGEMLYRLESYTLIFSGGFSSSCASPAQGQIPLTQQLKHDPSVLIFPQDQILFCVYPIAPLSLQLLKLDMQLSLITHPVLIWNLPETVPSLLSLWYLSFQNYSKNLIS